jgi:ADP-heptose:LPS heptosyltransferase
VFRTFSRLFLPNPLDWMLKKTRKKGGKKILLGWNRGLGDIALGLYAIVERIYEIIPDAEVTFITRENLREGFSMLPRVKTLFADWKRGEKVKIDPAIAKQYDLVINEPSPTDWVYWQRGHLTPKLKWNMAFEQLFEKFDLSSEYTYIGVQVVAETQYGLWRNWPLERWEELFARLNSMGKIKILLFGFGNTPVISYPNVIDLRGKTTLSELLSIIKNRCSSLILPDSGIASMTYYLNETFPLHLISLWADPNHGILKQNVPSPNQLLKYTPLIAKDKNLSNLSVDEVLQALFPVKNVGVVLLAGGLGTRLGFNGPKGLFEINGKTLFQLFAEKLPKETPVAIQVSTFNREETVAYFSKNQFFGLDIEFFEQEMVPYLDEEKKPLEILAPNGNGNVFRSLCKAALHEKFSRKGIEFISICYIDNPLAKPLDPVMLEMAGTSDVVVQCVRRESTDLKMGALVEKEGKVEIVEYTELDSRRQYSHAYSGQMMFSLPFFVEMGKVDLPLHWVQKRVDGRLLWKGEQFIFDVLPFAKEAKVLQVPRKSHYAPIKDRDSVEKVIKQLRELS